MVVAGVDDEDVTLAHLHPVLDHVRRIDLIVARRVRQVDDHARADEELVQIQAGDVLARGVKVDLAVQVGAQVIRMGQELAVGPICPKCATRCHSPSVSKLARHYASQDGRTALVRLLKVCYNAGSSKDGEEVVLKEATITYPRAVPQSVRMSDAEFAGEVEFLAAVKLYELGRLSSGKAAELVRMGRVEFL